MSARFLALSALLAASCAPATPSVSPRPPAGDAVTAQQWAATCPADAGWDEPGPPFRLHGNTWYVGTCGITALLIAGDDGLVLIDSGTDKGAEVVAANIVRLGFSLSEVKLILSSHEHHDHVGGVARLQRMTGARVFASAAAAPVLSTGTAGAGDPQAEIFDGFPPARVDGTVTPGTPVRLGSLSLMPVATPGHTPGALSWQWQSCDETGCRTMVYADSLSPISSDSYRFSDHPAYVVAYRAGLLQLANLDCDTVLTPHPAASGMYARAATGFPADAEGCTNYADSISTRLDTRLAQEHR